MAKRKKQHRSSKHRIKRRDPSAVKKRRTQSGSRFRSPFGGKYSPLKFKEGKNTIRFLPNTWDEDPVHYGLDVQLHYSVGVENEAFLCLGMRNKPCPICEEYRALKTRGEDANDEDLIKAAQEIRPVTRVVSWVIDRQDEDAGPQLCSLSWTQDNNINDKAEDEETGEALVIDDPDDGHDVIVKRDGTGLRTSYDVTVKQRSTPLSKDPKKMDAWLDFAIENPLPELLTFYDYATIEETLSGGVGSSSDDEKAYKKRKPDTRASKKRSKIEDDDDDDFEEDELDDELDDELEDEEDEADDFEEDEEDFEEEEDDDDFDEDEDDEDDEEDEEDEEDDEDDEDDDAEEDDEEDEDEEDDDEPVRPRKKSSSKSKKNTSTRAKVKSKLRNKKRKK